MLLSVMAESQLRSGPINRRDVRIFIMQEHNTKIKLEKISCLTEYNTIMFIFYVY